MGWFPTRWKRCNLENFKTLSTDQQSLEDERQGPQVHRRPRHLRIRNFRRQFFFNYFFNLMVSSVMVRLHCGKIRTKLVGFRKMNYFLYYFKPISLAFDCVNEH
jgi:hypothetical protein